MGNYPWLADSWPTTNLVHSGKEAANSCTTNHDTAERYYNGMSLLGYSVSLPVFPHNMTKQRYKANSPALNISSACVQRLVSPTT